MSWKKFKFRISTDGASAVKEEVTKTVVGDITRVSVSMGVTNDFDISPLHIFKNNKLTPVTRPEDTERGRGKPAIYYPLVDMSYICTLTYEIGSNNQIKNIGVIIYLPKGIVSVDEIYCERVTGIYTPEELKDIKDKLIIFAKTRI